VSAAQKLKTHCAAINAVLRETRKEFPKACLYLDGTGNLNLMSGPHHDDQTNSDVTSGVHGRQDRIICSASLNADAGDW
jgi:hypothetical protein